MKPKIWRRWRKKLRASVARRPVQPALERVFGWVLVGLGIGGATRPLDVNGEATFIAALADEIGPHQVLCVDVGANEGAYSEELIRWFGPRATIHSFEPSLETYRRLVHRLGSYDNVTTHQVALCDSVGHVELTSVTGRSQVASIYRPAGWDTSTTTVEVVPALTLDHWAREAGCSHIDLLKIDVEGAEYDVLNGGRDLINAGCVDLIQFEYGAQNTQSGATMKSICDLLGPEFEIFRMVIDGLVPVRPDSPLFEIPVSATNYVARRIK